MIKMRSTEQVHCVKRTVTVANFWGDNTVVIEVGEEVELDMRGWPERTIHTSNIPQIYLKDHNDVLFCITR